jgi:putative DNA primase/helicase
VAGKPSGLLVFFCVPVCKPCHLPLTPFCSGKRFNRTQRTHHAKHHHAYTIHNHGRKTPHKSCTQQSTIAAPSLRRRNMSTATITGIEDLFGTAMSAYGLNPIEIIADGNLHRFDCDDEKKGKKSGWYVLHGDGIPAGSFGSWKDDINEKWCGKSDHALTLIERTEYRERVEKSKQEAEFTKLALQAEASKASTMIWVREPDATENDPYCRNKGIKPYGLKRFKKTNTLIAAIRSGAGILTSLQFIDGDKEKDNKRFKSHGKLDGCYCGIGGKPTDTMLICEGFATGASLHQATGYPVAVAFTAGNLEAVARVLRGKLPEVKIIICADNDRFNDKGNVGMNKATAAALAVGALLATPVFQSDDGKPTDFNDLHQGESIEAVQRAIAGAVRPGAAVTHMIDTPLPEIDTGWPEPEPLTRITVAAPYPVDSLPEVVRLAVQEVQGFIKAPVAMVACSALANLSLAAQAHYDVARTEKLTGPIGLYFLVVAESGERKSTCDGIFSKVLRDYENQQQEDAKPEIKHCEADLSAWEAIKSGLVDGIKQAAKGGKDTDQFEQALRKHEEIKPELPRVPRLIYSDFTPEALTYSLAKKWPSGGVISSEAGAVFGSHGMGKESQMRTLSNLNQLWDASKLTFDRRGESYVVDAARLTMALQVQESALMEFIGRTGTLARGTGFMARFLIARPESTQGTRLFTEPPERTPSLENYYSQIGRILDTVAPINERGGLEPSMLTLTPDAKAAWIKFHDAIEVMLGKGGELQDVRDVASKIPDNAVRIAALFHIIDGSIGAISFEHFEAASIIAGWHLNEALRFFGELALPEAMADAALLDGWLIDYCRGNGVDMVSTRTVSRLGPGRLRTKEKLQAAVQELIEHGRVLLIQNGKKREIQINPQLLRG